MNDFEFRGNFKKRQQRQQRQHRQHLSNGVAGVAGCRSEKLLHGMRGGRGCADLLFCLRLILFLRQQRQQIEIDPMYYGV